MNVSNIKDCYGCGVCSIACNHNVINISLNPNGFYEPRIIDASKCTNCGLCIEVCSYSQDKLASPNKYISSYAAWSNDYQIHHKCSSGGVSFEIGRTLINKSYKVCGVKYNLDTNCAEHYIAATIEELIPTIGSKYIQSYTVNGFKAINRKEKYLVTGTPCQIDSFRRYIQKFHCEDNFILMDFFCHSVPSMLLWKKYIQEVEKITGKITSVSWRNKLTGWHDSWAMSIDGVQKEKKMSYNSRLSQGDIFYQSFLGDFCTNPACRNKCKYKYDKSSADIRIGDLWGKTYSKNEDGVSAVIAYTLKGKEVLQQSNCTLIEHPFETVAEGQMKKNCGKAKLSVLLNFALHMDYATLKVLKAIILAEKFLNIPHRVINKFKKMLFHYENRYNNPA